jgi:hypothetical protein
MADRTSAELFGSIFKMLAENPTEEHKEIAGRIYSMVSHYDFSDYQMYADEACVALDIARMGVNPEHPEIGKVVLWPGEDGYEGAIE